MLRHLIEKRQVRPTPDAYTPAIIASQPYSSNRSSFANAAVAFDGRSFPHICT